MYPYLECLPDYLREIKEFQAIAEGVNDSADASYQYTDQISKDLCITTASEPIVARWEAIFRIRPAARETLEDRRSRIQALFLGQMPVTEWTLRGMLNDLCSPDGYQMTIHYNTYVLRVRMRPKASGKLSQVSDLLQQVRTAGLLIDLAILYNTHGELCRFTHAQLRGRKHRAIREEEL